MFEGSVVALFVAPTSDDPMQERDRVEALAGVGIEGDRYATGDGLYSGKGNKKRHVTLIETEALDGIRVEDGIELEPIATRRNILTRGVPLNHLVGRTFRVGPVVLRGVDLSEPCVVLEGRTQPGVREALIHRGGLRAEIVEGGPIRVGDAVLPGDDPAAGFA